MAKLVAGVFEKGADITLRSWRAVVINPERTVSLGYQSDPEEPVLASQKQ
jgi:hypothetical protein